MVEKNWWVEELKSAALLLFLGLGILVSYLTYGLAQEELYRDHGDVSFSDTSFLLLVQTAMNCIGGLIGTFVFPRVARLCNPSISEPPSTPKPKLWTVESQSSKWSEGFGGGEGVGSGGWDLVFVFLIAVVLFVAFTYLFSMWCTNEALRYVPYPFQILAKSCKSIPVLLGQVVIGGRSHPWYRYVSVFVMAVGVGGYSAARKGVSLDFASLFSGVGGEEEGWGTMYGYLLLLTSLLCDAYTGPTQDGLIPAFGLTGTQLMALQNAWATALVGVAVMVRGTFYPTIHMLLSHPSMLQALLLFGVCSALGQFFIFAVLSNFDSLILTTVTTVRKFLSILISVIYYQHPQTPTQLLLVLLVFLAILADKTLSVMYKKKKKEKEEEEDEAQVTPQATPAPKETEKGTMRRRK